MLAVTSDQERDTLENQSPLIPLLSIKQEWRRNVSVCSELSNPAGEMAASVIRAGSKQEVAGEKQAPTQDRRPCVAAKTRFSEPA